MLLSPIDKPIRQKLSRKSLELNDTIKQMNSTVIYRALHANIEKYTFFSASHGNFFKTDHVLEHKASLNKYRNTGIISCILPKYSEIKLNVNSNKNYRKPQTHGS